MCSRQVGWFVGRAVERPYRSVSIVRLKSFIALSISFVNFVFSLPFTWPLFGHPCSFFYFCSFRLWDLGSGTLSCLTRLQFSCSRSNWRDFRTSVIRFCILLQNPEREEKLNDVVNGYIRQQVGQTQIECLHKELVLIKSQRWSSGRHGGRVPLRRWVQSQTHFRRVVISKKMP